MSWTNEIWTIESTPDTDYVEIIGPHQYCKMAGGDFESILSALCAAFDSGRLGVRDENNVE